MKLELSSKSGKPAGFLAFGAAGGAAAAAWAPPSAGVAILGCSGDGVSGGCGVFSSGVGLPGELPCTSFLCLPALSPGSGLHVRKSSSLLDISRTDRFRDEYLPVTRVRAQGGNAIGRARRQLTKQRRSLRIEIIKGSLLLETCVHVPELTVSLALLQHVRA